jgi:hypothetical protein
MRALSHVHDIEERRSALRHIAAAGGLAIAVCVIGSMLLLVAAPRAVGYAD